MEKLTGLYYTRHNGNKFEIKINTYDMKNNFDDKYYLFINDKFIKAYKYKTSLYNYVRNNYDTNLMF